MGKRHIQKRKPSTLSKSSSATQTRKKQSTLSRKTKKKLRTMGRSITFFSVLGATLVIGYDFVEGFYQEKLEYQQVEANKVIPIHDIELQLKEEVTLKFFIEQLISDESQATQLTTVERALNSLVIKERANIPYPYLKAICPKSNQQCTVQEAENFTLYLRGEDISSIQIQ